MLRTGEFRTAYRQSNAAIGSFLGSKYDGTRGKRDTEMKYTMDLVSTDGTTIKEMLMRTCILHSCQFSYNGLDLLSSR